jgi:tetratricopeptide (TPR) repeat protein
MMSTRNAIKGSGALMVALFVAISGAAQAAGEPTDRNATTWQSDPVVTQLETFTSRKDWQGAAAFMKTAVERNPRSADYNNLYAYVMRKGPNPNMDLVFKHYNEALRIDPNHRGAHEYIGEAYLMVKDLARAKEHLAVLDRLCTFGCEEYTDLKKAVAQYEAGNTANTANK